MSSQRAAQELQRTAEYLHGKAARRSGEAASALRDAAEMVAARASAVAAEQRDEVVELRERLCNADAELIAMTAAGRTRYETERLTGKAEGVRLAISYLDEIARGL